MEQKFIVGDIVYFAYGVGHFPSLEGRKAIVLRSYVHGSRNAVRVVFLDGSKETNDFYSDRLHKINLEKLIFER